MALKRKFTWGDAFIVLIVSVTAITIIYPFWNTIMVSLVSQKEYSNTPFMLFPKQPTLDAYKFIFEVGRIFDGLKVTSILVILGVPFNLFLTTTLAYALSKQKFPGYNLFLNLIIFTMFFSGGLIPTYLLINNTLHMADTLASMIIPTGVSVFNFFVIRNYFLEIPESLEESAKVDGANEIYTFIHIILPLSKPVLATFGLFYAVDRWNEWFNAMLYIQSADKFPLQYMVRQIISNFQEMGSLGSAQAFAQIKTYSDAIQMAFVFLTTVPIMVLYPFLQRYFTKGMMIGAVKS